MSKCDGQKQYELKIASSVTSPHVTSYEHYILYQISK